jgi:DNA-binding NtrC family response regulator
MLPRVLVIDDLFGRDTASGPNVDRDNLCAQFLWEDATGDGASVASGQQVLAPQAQAVFCRGQQPSSAVTGDVVENDLAGTIAMSRDGWDAAFARGDRPWAMVLLDLCFYTGRVTPASTRLASGMPEGRTGDDDPNRYFGLAILDALHRACPELPVFIISSKPRDDVSLELSRRGALGFIPRDHPDAARLFADALDQHGLLPDSDEQIVGHSLPVLAALREARRAARHRANLLLRGERGSGKELLAAYVHRASQAPGDPARPLVTVNAAVLRTDLFASELFGIVPRAATGVDGKTGLIEEANGGDLFLDEIADMPAEAQAALLRVLQERQITPVGSRRPKHIDVRFLSATNAGLEGDQGMLRPDLLDRLRLGGTLWLPPLSSRLTDLPRLVQKFVRQAERERPGTLRREITREALDTLLSHSWPGNIRELRGTLFDAVNRFPDVEHLVPGHLRLSASVTPAARAGSQPAPPSTASVDSNDLDSLLSQLDRVRFDQAAIAQWSGRFRDVQEAHARMIARYLQAAIDATRRRTADRPGGLVQIHPAVKLLSGDHTLTASKAADIVKRILAPIADDLNDDLREALKVAVRLRPRGVKASRDAS